MQRTRSTPSRQHGLSMIGFLFVAIVLVAVAMLAMKLVPAYIEFFSVKKILATMTQESDFKSKSNAELRNDFTKRANVGYVTVVKPEDLSIDRRGGIPVVSANYAFRTKLVGNVSLVVDFSASSDPNAVPAQIE
jgi:Tfp pilus assembly protein PilV